MQAAKAGWALARKSPELHAGKSEVEITEQLRDGMRSVLNSGRFPWGDTMIVLSGAESRSEPETPTLDGLTAIPIMLIEVFFRYGEHDPHAIIECKRISGYDSRLCREYVNEGIDRFKTGKYASNHANGFMAGYVIAGDSLAARAQVEECLRLRLLASELIELSERMCDARSSEQVTGTGKKLAAPPSPPPSRLRSRRR